MLRRKNSINSFRNSDSTNSFSSAQSHQQRKFSEPSRTTRSTVRRRRRSRSRSKSIKEKTSHRTSTSSRSTSMRRCSSVGHLELQDNRKRHEEWQRCSSNVLLPRRDQDPRRWWFYHIKHPKENQANKPIYSFHRIHFCFEHFKIILIFQNASLQISRAFQIQVFEFQEVQGPNTTRRPSPENQIPRTTRALFLQAFAIERWKKKTQKRKYGFKTMGETRSMARASIRPRDRGTVGTIVFFTGVLGTDPLPGRLIICFFFPSSSSEFSL
jgi:hypothetical protein